MPAASDDAEFQARFGAFLQGLGQLGRRIGQNVRNRHPLGQRKRRRDFAGMRRSWSRLHPRSFWPMARGVGGEV